MGIEIVSVLAKHSTKLASSSGVTQKPRRDCHGHVLQLPLFDPERKPSQQVVKVISQWSEGHSHRPPTWEELLVVLRDIDLLQLSQSIEDFMNGK